MRTFVVVLQGYERETGRGFRVRFRLRAPDISTARTIALEEAVREGLSFAVLETQVDIGPAPEGSEPKILAASARDYMDEDIPADSPSQAPRARNSD